MRFVLVLLGILTAALAPASAQVELNIQKCREMALESSKKMAIADKQLLKAGYDKKAYRANFFPKLSAMGMYAYMQKDYSFKIEGGNLPTFVPGENTLVPNYLLDANGKVVVGADGRPVFAQYAFMPDIAITMGLDNAYTLGAVLEMPVYMGGKIRNAYQMAEVGTEMAKLNVNYNRAEVIMEVENAFWQYVRLQELELSAQKYREVVSELVHNLTDAQQVGMVSKNDLLKAQVKQNEAELLLQKTQNGKRLAGMNLCRVIGLDLNTAVKAADSLTGFVTPGVLESGVVITNRPEYSILDKEVELKERQVNIVRSDFLPQLGVSVSYGYTDGINVNGETDGIASFMAMASLKVPVFHWSEGRNKIKAMRAEQEMTELKKEDAEQMMVLEATKARFNVEDALTRVKLTEHSLLQAEENLAESKNKYELGLEILTNYMEAQAQWQKAWSDWIDAKAELRLSETHYLKATGRL
ncbi:TolC family protein [Odoribacter lunatus]|uniref:TolC family protein n=1 Tax=Odoribacter lunatus TaxID=2941335 RepID=UPI00203DE1C1|nr:TolC family protein [Odoribacter lunatus]